MTLDTEQRIETQEINTAKPPPYLREERGYHNSSEPDATASDVAYAATPTERV
jgi:hypothetical protein